MGRTTIEWTRGDDGSFGETWNPIRGCSRVSEGCRNCYAERQAIRQAAPRLFGENPKPSAYEGLVRSTPEGPRWTGKIRLVRELLDEPLRWRKPRRVFVNSMSDLFHEGVPDHFINSVWKVMACAPQHTFQILTKRPNRMRAFVSSISDRILQITTASPLVESRTEWSDDAMHDAIAENLRAPLPNVWLGVSVENQETADERIPLLLQTPAAVRFLSVEPLLGAVDLDGVWGYPGSADADQLDRWPIQWVIVGGESGPGARPVDVAWIRSIVAQCRAASVPCFVKQLGARVYDSAYSVGVYAPEDRRTPTGDDGAGGRMAIGNLVLLRDRKGGDPAEWPEDLRVREFPR